MAYMKTLVEMETLRSEGHKVLVFSQSVQALSLLRTKMEARSMTTPIWMARHADVRNRLISFKMTPGCNFS